MLLRQFWKGACFLLCLGWASCQSTTATEPPSEPATATVERRPDHWIEQGGQKIGWYTFEQLKPLLYADNDTTYVVNFWATWCKPCIEELPAFQQLYKKYKNEKVHLLMVSLDFDQQITSKYMPFIEEHDLQGEHVVLSQKNSNEWIEQINSRWSGSIPATLIYQGKRRQFFEQTFEFHELDVKLRHFMNLN